ncbi:MAG: carbon storage regulator [Pirellulales bacterium]
MLVLSRKIGESICVAEDIVVVVKWIKGDRVSIGIEAPKKLRVLRGELQDCPPSGEGRPKRVCGR